MNWADSISCRCCGHIYPRPPLNREGYSCWQCPACGLEERLHISPRRVLDEGDDETWKRERRARRAKD